MSDIHLPEYRFTGEHKDPAEQNGHYQRGADPEDALRRLKARRPGTYWLDTRNVPWKPGVRL